MGRGMGLLSLEEGTANDKPLVVLVFRNSFGSILFQGQLMRNVSKITKKKTPKVHKVQRLVSVVGKKADGKTGFLKCQINVMSVIAMV